MKCLSSILLLISICLSVDGQSWTSSNSLQGTGDISDIQSTIDIGGNVITLGYFEGTLASSDGKQITSNGGRDYFISKYTPSGDIEWLINLGGIENEFLYGGISASDDGHFFVTGGFRNILNYSPTEFIQSFNADDIFLAKFDTDGNVIWFRNMGTGQRNQRSTSLDVDPAGDIILSGFFVDSINFDGVLTLYNDDAIVDYFYGKFDPATGDPIWAKQLRGLDNALSGRIFDISSSSDSYLFAGVFFGSIGFETDTIISENNTQDVHLIKSDLSGNIDWIRQLSGDDTDYTFSATFDPAGNIYMGGYSNSTIISIDSTDNDVITLSDPQGGYDVFVTKYSSSGQLQWVRTNGGIGSDIILDIEVFNSDDNIYVTGHFADTMYWGGIELATEGLGGFDMFIGSLNEDGNYRTANSFSGRNNSEEESFSIFENGPDLYSVIRSNSDVLVLGDSIYTSSGDYFYLAFGVIGCRPISIDNTIITDITTCYGDSTGSIQIETTGGFGAPWVYSIDNNETSSATNYFGDLPAKEYQIVVVDKEGCTEVGSVFSLTQPDTLEVTYTTTDIMVDTLDDDFCTVDITDGSISAVVTGGTGPFEYVLFPGGILQTESGTFDITPGDSGKYVIRVDDSENCGPVEADSIDVLQFGSGGDCIPLGIEDGLADQVKMYPNPTTGLFTLEMPFNKAECSMEVFNMNGQVVLQQQLYPNSGKIAETIDLSNVPKGLYLLRIDGRALQSAVVVK